MNQRKNVQRDETQSPVSPQYQLGATSDEAETHQQIVKSPLGGPGDIVGRLGQQFQFPKASPDVTTNKQFHNNLGEIG